MANPGDRCNVCSKIVDFGTMPTVQPHSDGNLVSDGFDKISWFSNDPNATAKRGEGGVKNATGS